MGRPKLDLNRQPAPYIEPTTLREWYLQGRQMMLLDTRNQYEVACGTFEQALDFGLKNFRSFPEATARLPAQAKQLADSDFLHRRYSL